MRLRHDYGNALEQGISRAELVVAFNHQRHAMSGYRPPRLRCPLGCPEAGDVGQRAVSITQTAVECTGSRRRPGRPGMSCTGSPASVPG
jgi:hypothetical protein